MGWLQTGGTRAVNRTLAAKTRSLAMASLRVYTNLDTCPEDTPITPEFVISAYHRLSQVEKSFRMSERGLQAQPIRHRTRDPIEAHPTIVLDTMAVGHLIKERAGWSIRKCVQTACHYRTIKIWVRTRTRRLRTSF